MELEAVSSLSQAVVISNDKLLTQILVRLPMKPLVRFKLVSKRWNSLVSDPKLHKTFNQMPHPAAGLIFQGPFRSASARVLAPYAPLVVTFDESSTSSNLTAEDELTGIWRLNVKPLNSCNGLLLCGSNYRLRPTYYVCNPTTGNYFTLMTLGCCERLAGICLAFDPAKSPHYSVVCVYSLSNISKAFESLYQYEVFSSETGCWRKNGEPFKACGDFSSRGVYWNGSVHWICSSDKSLYFNPNENDQTPAPKVMPTPHLKHYRHSFRALHYFGESGGHLNFIENAYKCGGKCIVQEMRDDYSEWFVKYRVDLSFSTVTEMGDDYSKWFVTCSMRALIRGKEDEDSFLVFLIGRRLVRYNLVYNTLQTIFQFEDKEQERRYCHDSFLRRDFPLQYIESFCSV